MKPVVKTIIKDLSPPLLLRTLLWVRGGMKRQVPYLISRSSTAPDEQSLDVYWTPVALQAMEVWGQGTTWDEIQYLLCGRQGRVLDIACGSGKPMEILSRFPGLEIHGIDISDFLINKAIERGVPRDRLRVGDATNLDYPDKGFDYSYSIGSLEHFTEQGITSFVAECHRVTRAISFHQVPVSRSGTNEGWLRTTVQSYFNCATEWWVEHFRKKFPIVEVLDSHWEDEMSVGKWFICINEQGG